MAPSEAKSIHIADSLASLIDDVLIQTGKALLASRDDSNTGSFYSKVPDTTNKFHLALDEIDSEIIRAKSVFQRDLAEVRAKKASPTPASEPEVQVVQPPPPKPVDAQSKEPIVIDLDSSPRASESPVISKTEVPAPFPDMGMGMGMGMSLSLDPESTIKPGADSSVDPVKKELDMSNEKIPPTAQAAPMPNMDVDPLSQAADTKSNVPVAAMGDSSFNFTNMEFTVDPSANEGFPQDDTNNMVSLDSLLPAALPSAKDETSNNGQLQNAFQGTLDDPADGMDFDFGLGDDEFNKYMDSRDESAQMDDSDFNNAYFNVESIENA